jgi:hypothetical protein
MAVDSAFCSKWCRDLVLTALCSMSKESRMDEVVYVRCKTCTSIYTKYDTSVISVDPDEGFRSRFPRRELDKYATRTPQKDSTSFDFDPP